MEYRPTELVKRTNGKGGVWRIPPSFDGHRRSPHPRFTVRRGAEMGQLREFFHKLACCLYPVFVPGAHVFIATHPLVSHLVYEAFVSARFESAVRSFGSSILCEAEIGPRTLTRSLPRSA